MVVQNDQETIERSLRSFYQYVEAILVTTDPKTGWSGQPIVPDGTVDIIRNMDTDNKIRIIERNFYVYAEPMRNDTAQRQFSSDKLGEWRKDLDWIAQVDADEEFMDFRQFIEVANTVPRWTKCIYWNWIMLFRLVDNEKMLVVAEPDGSLKKQYYPLAHRPNAKLDLCRTPSLPRWYIPRLIRWNHYARPDCCALHYTFAKSAARIQEKLRTWSHANDFDTKAYYALWEAAAQQWDTMKNFHPTHPELWPRLRPVERRALGLSTV